LGAIWGIMNVFEIMEYKEKLRHGWEKNFGMDDFRKLKKER
jgi:hypothetical protein